jgi:hypothetical protein
MKKILFVLLVALFGLGSYIHAQSHSCECTARLSDDEARILLYVVPASVAARRAGTDVDIEKSEPTAQYPASDFFVAALVSRKPTSGSALANGILGYFAVDKRTGAVESTVDLEAVHGKELSRVQGWLRHAHCIPIGASGK